MSELTAVVLHGVHGERFAEADRRIRGNGDRMAACAGFIERRYLVDDADAANPVLVTITRWKDRTSYDAWVEQNRATNPHKGTVAPFDTHQTIVLAEYPAKA